MPKVPAYNRSVNLIKGEPDKKKIKPTTIDRTKYQSILDKPLEGGDNFVTSDLNAMTPAQLEPMGFNYYSGTVKGKDAVYKKGNNYYMYNEKPSDTGGSSYAFVNIGDLSEPKPTVVQDTVVTPKVMPIDPMKVEGFNGMKAPIVEQYKNGGKVKGYAEGGNTYQAAIDRANARQNDSRNAKIAAATKIGGAALLGYSNSVYQEPEDFTKSETERANEKNLTNTVDATASSLTPWYAAAKGVSNLGRKQLKKDEYGNVKTDSGLAADEWMKPQHEHMIDDYKREGVGGVAKEVLLGTSNMRAVTNLLGKGDKTTGFWGFTNKFTGETNRRNKANESTRIQQQAEIDAENKAYEEQYGLTRDMKVQNALAAREAGDTSYQDNIILPAKKAPKVAYSPYELEQENNNKQSNKARTLIAQKEEQDRNGGNPNPQRNGGFLGKALGKIGMMADGGVVSGKGGPKSDSINAKVEAGSFIVPAENAPIAKELAAKVLRKAPSKKANLNQGGETPVKLSDGEYMFTPEEKMELVANGIDLEALAPNAELKHGGRVPKYDKGTPPSGVKGGNINKIISDINAQQNKIKQEQSKIRSINQAKIQAERDANKKAELIKQAREAENTANQRAMVLETKKKKVESLYSQYEAAPEKSTSASVKPKEQYLNDINEAVSDYKAQYEKYNPTVTADKTQYVSSDFPTLNYGLKKGDGNTQMTQAEIDAASNVIDADIEAKAAINAAKGVGGKAKSAIGQRNASLFAPSAVTVDDVDAPRPTDNVNTKGEVVIEEPSMAQFNAANTSSSNGNANVTNPTPSSTPTSKSKVDWQGLADNAIGYGLPIVQGAIGFKKLKELGKRPKDKLDQDYLNAIATTSGDVQTARQNAKFGFTGEEKAALNQENAALTNAGRFAARNLAGGSGANMLGAERSVINDAFGRKLQSRISDNALRLQKQEQAMARQQDLNNMVAHKAELNRRLFTDNLNAWSTDQTAAGGLINAGLSSALETMRYNKFKKQYDDVYKNQNG